MPSSADSLRQLRLRAGWSLDQLAARTGVSKTAIGLIERGQQTPRRFALCRLADALQVDASELAARFGQPDPTPTAPSAWAPSQVGGELARWRARAGDSQPDLAAAAGVSVDTVLRVERDRRLLPAALARIAGDRYGFDIAAALAAAGYDVDLASPSQWGPGHFVDLWPRLRQLAGLSVRDVADAIGASPAAVGYWTERGSEPTDGQLAPLAAVLADRLGWHPVIAGLDRSTLAQALGRSRRRADTSPH